MIKKEMIAMLLAGGQGSRLGVLTSKVASRLSVYGPMGSTFPWIFRITQVIRLVKQVSSLPEPSLLLSGLSS